MAKKASAKAGSGERKRTGSARKPAAAKATRPKAATKPAARAKAKPKTEQQQQQHGAADALIKLLESPLVVDLIAVGATAALAAIAEKRFGRRDEDDAAASKSAAKAAGKAAAAAMGRRISSEVEEILKASKKPTGDAKA